MNIREAIRIMDENFEKRKKIRIEKDKDYADVGDCLKNFKSVAKLIEILNIDLSKSYGVAMAYSILKIDRICNLLFNKVSNPINESIEDSINDLQNYLDLFRECLIDEYSVKEKDKYCPECGVKLLHQEGCTLCPNCGYSKCMT